jgi:hypothetical protein
MILMKKLVTAGESLFLSGTPTPPGCRPRIAPGLLGRNGTRLLISCPNPWLRRYEFVGAMGIEVNGGRPSSGGRQIQKPETVLSVVFG